MFAAIKTGIASVAIAGLVAGGVAVVHAQETDAPVDTVATDAAVDRPSDARHGRGVAKGREMLEAIEDILGVNQGEIVSTLRTGGTIAELAEAQGVGTEELIEQLVAIVEAHVDEAVEAGRIDAEKAEEILANAEDRIERFVTTPHEPGERRGHRDRRPGFELGAAAAEILGLTPGELRAQIEEGATLAEIAEAQGMDTDALVDALVAVVEERVDAAVADGRMDAEKAEQILADARDRIERMVTTPLSELRDARRDHRRDGARHLLGAAAAEVLGLTPEDLKGEIEAGATLAEIAESQGIGTDELVDALIDAVTEKLEAAADEGRIDEAELDEKLEALTERIEALVTGEHD